MTLGRGDDVGPGCASTRRAMLSAQRATRSISRTTMDVLADSYDRGSAKRNASLRILLGTLFSHGLQICILPVTIQEGILRRVVAQLIGRPDMPVTVLLLLYTLWAEWRVVALAMRRERRLFSSMDKKFSKQSVDLFFDAWLTFHKEELMQRRAAMDALLMKKQQADRITSLFDLVNHQGAAKWLLVEHFTLWRTEMEGAREQAREEAKRLTERLRKEKTLGGITLLMSSMRASADNVLKAEVFRGWLTAKQEMKELEVRAARIFAELGGGTLQLHSAFQGWHDVLATTKDGWIRLRPLMLLILHGIWRCQAARAVLLYGICFEAWRDSIQELAVTKEKSKKFLMFFVGQRDENLLEMTFAGWRGEGRKERFAREQQHSRTHRQEIVMRFSQLLAAQSSEALALLASSFLSWLRISSTEKAERDSKNKEAAFFGKSLQLLLSGNSRLLLNNAFRAWQMAMVEERNEKRVQMLQQHQQVQNESKMKAMVVMFDGNDEMLLANIFRAWVRDVVEKERAIRQQAEAMTEQAEKLMRWFAAESGNNLLAGVVSVWNQITKDNIYSCRSRAQAAKMLGLITEGNSQFELAKVFAGWHRQIVLQKEKLVANRRMVFKTLHWNNAADLQLTFQEWYRALEKERQERRHAEQGQLLREQNLAKGAKLIQQVFMLSSVKFVFRSWYNIYEEKKVEQKRYQQINALNLMQDGLQAPVMATLCIDVWKNAVIARKQDEQLNRWLTDKAKSEAKTQWATGKIFKTAGDYFLMEVCWTWAHFVASEKLERTASNLALHQQHFPQVVTGLVSKIASGELKLSCARVFHGWQRLIATRKSRLLKVTEIALQFAYGAGAAAAPVQAAFVVWRWLAHLRRSEEEAADRLQRVVQASLVRWLAADIILAMGAAFRWWLQAAHAGGLDRRSKEARAVGEEAAAWRTEAQRRGAAVARTQAVALEALGKKRAFLPICWTAWRCLLIEGREEKEAATRRSRLERQPAASPARSAQQKRAVAALDGSLRRARSRLALSRWRAAVQAERPHAAATSPGHGRHSEPGALYVFGGFGAASPAEAERWDAATGRWEPLPRMPRPRCAAAAACFDGRLYVLGGFSGREHLCSVDAFEPQARRWAAAPELHERRGYVAAAAGEGESGGLYAIGGFNGFSRLSSVERFALGGVGWAALPPMTVPRQSAAAACIEGLLYVAGGADGGGSMSSAEVFDLRTGSWRPLPPMSARRSAAAGIAVRGRFVVAGGSDVGPLGSVELFDPRSSSWSPLPPMRVRRDALGAAAISDSLYVFGGHDGQLRQRSFEVLRPGASTWEELPEHTLGRNFAAVACTPC